MITDALGLIETHGLIPAVEAADIAVKSAHVRLGAFQYVGAGLVTVTLLGDVASVKAAVEAGTASASRLGRVVSSHVIPRLGEGMDTLVVPAPTPQAPRDSDPTDPDPIGPDPTDLGSEDMGPTDPTPRDDGFGKDLGAGMQTTDPCPGAPKEGSAHRGPDASGLKKMRVSKLRHLARQLEGMSLSRKEIKFARKKELVEAILAVHRQKEE